MKTMTKEKNLKVDDRFAFVVVLFFCFVLLKLKKMMIFSNMMMMKKVSFLSDLVRY